VVARHTRLFAHDLERTRLLRTAIPRGKYLAHPALPQTFADLVAVVVDRTWNHGRLGFGLWHPSCRVERGHRARPTAGPGQKRAYRLLDLPAFRNRGSGWH